MRCALEMKIALIEKAAKEEEEREAALRAKLANEMVKYLDYLPRLNQKVEQELLDNNGVAELLLDTDFRCLDGFYFVGWQEAISKSKYYWELRRSSAANIHLDHYCQMLRDLCYEVTFEETSFIGYSSTGKTHKPCKHYKLIIKIPQ